MESPGEYLKREREQRGVSLDDIFKATRVPMKHLAALEADNFDAMPHPTFIKGYIRSYCKVLGVDENDAVLRYEIYLKDKTDKSDRPEEQKPVVRFPQPSKKIQRPPLLGQFWGDKRNVIMVAVGAGVLVVIIAALLISGSKSPAPLAPADERGAEQAPETTPGPNLPHEIAPVSAEPAKPSKPVNIEEKASEPAKTAEPARLRHSLIVKASDTVWIQATIDNGEPFDVTLKDDETVLWKAADTLVLKVGNAGGVSLTFDGKPMAPLGEAGYVVRVTLPGGKVEVLARPKPEPTEPTEPPEPEAEPAPAQVVEEPEPAPGVDIKELLPLLSPPLSPEADAQSPEPSVVPGVDIKDLLPAVTPLPATAPAQDVKGPEEASAPQKDAEEPASESPRTQEDEADRADAEDGPPPAP